MRSIIDKLSLYRIFIKHECDNKIFRALFIKPKDEYDDFNLLGRVLIAGFDLSLILTTSINYILTGEQISSFYIYEPAKPKKKQIK